jgi:hypothetical protein
MNPERQRMNRLFALARRARRPTDAPAEMRVRPGLASRVAVRWVQVGAAPGLSDMWERLCWWGTSVAAAICLVALVHRELVPASTSFEILLEVPMAAAEQF